MRESMPMYLFATATVGLAVTLYMAYAAFFVLKAVCVLCLTTYAAVIGLFIVSGLSSSMPPMTTLPRRLIGDLRALVARPALASVVIVFLAGAVSAVAFFPDEAALRSRAAQQQSAQPVTADQRSEFERFWDSQPRMTVPVQSDGAAVVIVKFTDVQCPQCGVTFFELRPILSKYQAQYPGAVKYITKDYPLQMECNSNVPRPIHTAACDAAVAVRLARQRNKGDSLEEYLYAHQSTMSPASVRDAAFVIAGVQDFDLQYPRVIGDVKADVSLGHLLGVTGTPTFFINGVRIVAAAPQTIDLAIAYELKKAGKIR
jgi:protein-disulfide isomerase